MADEFVRREHFDDLIQSIHRHFDDLNRRFDSLERRMEEGFSELRADMRQIRHWLMWLFGLMAVGFISIALTLIRDLIFK